MNLGNLGLFKLMSRKMSWLTQRQEVVAQNIANANTPDYRGRDIKPFTFREALKDQRLMPATVTSAKHLNGTRGPAGEYLEQRQKNPYETAPDGNNVVLEEQMLKMNKNAMDYQMVTNLYKKQVSMIKMAIRSGGS